MEIKLFTKSFLDELQEKSKGIDLLQYLMLHQKKTFKDAILEIAQYFEMQPKYFESTKKVSNLSDPSE